MKTKEELLKIYSSYLPYELQISINDEGEQWSETVIGVNKEALETNVGNYWDLTIKPILYSMDYLTKEIEHKGERFIPIEKFEIGDDDSGIEYDHGNIRLIKDLESISKYNSYHDIQFLPFEVVQRLIEWHFNVFNLSDSEFIKKETLK